jgi:hypothetical protein
MPGPVKAIAFTMLGLNLFFVLFLFMASGEANSHSVYMSVLTVINQMVKTGAITIDESRTTVVDGWPEGYQGSPAIPIAHAAMKANHMFVFPMILVGANSLAMLVVGISARGKTSPRMAT